MCFAAVVVVLVVFASLVVVSNVFCLGCGSLSRICLACGRLKCVCPHRHTKVTTRAILNALAPFPPDLPSLLIYLPS
eukprot:357630-Chlamydomonas_euryale.AAC.3